MTKRGSPKAGRNAKGTKNKNPAEKPTVGEELWSVHLHRGETPSEGDFDRDAPLPSSRERSRSVGEELWEVHLNRSKGLEPDLDVDDMETTPTTEPRKATIKVKPAKKPERCSARLTMHLRNRDVKKMLIR